MSLIHAEIGSYIKDQLTSSPASTGSLRARRTAARSCIRTAAGTGPCHSSAASSPTIKQGQAKGKQSVRRVSTGRLPSHLLPS